MSATLVSSNTTIKINGGGSTSVGAPSSATITAAANEYIIMSFSTTSTSNVYSIGGQSRNFPASNEIYTLYIPPGASCTVTSTVGNVAYNFVRFINTP